MRSPVERLVGPVTGSELRGGGSPSTRVARARCDRDPAFPAEFSAPVTRRAEARPRFVTQCVRTSLAMTSPVPRILVRSLAILVPLAVAAVTGCSALDPVDGVSADGQPGSRTVATGDPTCKSDSECASGEQCTDGVCQMQRCGAQNYASTAPLGRRRTFASDREILVVSDDATRRALDGYEPTDGSFAHPDALTIDFGSVRVVDAAGGNLTGSRPEAVAVALDGSTKLAIVAGKARSDLDVGLVPVAVAAGDIDGDGTDEVVALAKDGSVAVCKATTKTCERKKIEGVVGKDVVVADVDADGHAEPVVLVDVPGAKSALVVLNLDAAETNQQEQVRTSSDVTLVRLSAGIFGGSATTVVALEDGGYADFSSDVLHLFGFRDAKLAEVSKSSIAKDALDVLVSDTDGDDKPEILVLEKSGLEVYRASDTTLTPATKTALTASRTPSRLLAADLDGDSPVGTLMNTAPVLVPGPVVPVAVLMYPPYSRSWSDGTSVIGLGASESKTVDTSKTVSLNAGASLGFDFGITDIAKASVSASVDKSWSTTTSSGRSITVGDSFWISANPTLEGQDNGVAVLACACYHQYDYKLEDPAGRLGGREVDGRVMSVFVPVGGQTSVWSLKRYNVMASKAKGLPVIKAPYVVGDVDSYPTAMSKLDGKPVPPEDLLFTNPRTYRTSDVARVSWSLDTSEYSVKSESQSIGVHFNGSVKVGPVSVGASVGVSQSESYSVSVGKSATFSGGVPPVRNDVRTPEDEHELHGYGFSPVVYRDRYKTPDGVEGGYYVVTYTVSR